MGFPQVTTVATNWGARTTAPIRRSLQQRIYVGLKPYNDATWNGEIHRKPS